MSSLIPSVVDMLKAGVHFGHRDSRWHPKMLPFIFTKRSGVHILNLEKTAVLLEEAAKAAKQMASEGKVILFTTTKPQAREIVRKAAEDCGMPFLIDRWLGGLLTNFSEMRKLLKKYRTLKEQQASGEFERYTKKERVELDKKLSKMDEMLGGIASLERMPDALFVPAMQREKTAVTEARKTSVQIFGVCDTNANPNHATYVIPANDDAVNSIALVVNVMSQAIAEGRKEWEKKKAADFKNERVARDAKIERVVSGA